MIIRKTRPQEAERVNELFSIAFEQPLENGPAGEENCCHWAAFEESTGEMTSTLTVTDFTVNFDGHPCKMGGIGGVATLPAYRRQGGIRGIFQEALKDMYREGYVFSYLYPFSTGYYRKFGYENCVRKLSVTVDLGLLSPRKCEGSLVLAEPGHDLTTAVQAVEEAWESRYNMMVLHGKEAYRWVAQSNPARKQQFTYVYFDPVGTAKAYTRFHLENQPDGRNLVSDRFFFLDRAGFDGLMNLYNSMASDHRYVKFTLPSEPAMAYLMPEWSLGAVAWSVLPAGMVRVVDVKRALELATYRGSGQVALQISDAQIAENNGVFRVRYENGCGVSVEKTDGNPDLILPISAFSALLSGVCDGNEAMTWMPEARPQRENLALDGIFYQKPLFLVDYF